MNSNNPLFKYGEAAVFCLLFLYAGLYFRPSDPFLLFSAYKLYVPFALVLTLAGGTGPGLVALAFAGALARFYYSPYPYQPLLWTALITLAAGEFKIYWDRKIRMYAQERDYFREKLKDLSRNFVILKMSHERLEKNYILRPVSIRSSLESIRAMLQDRGCEAAQSLMDLLGNFYGLESASLFVRRQQGAAGGCGMDKLFEKDPGQEWAEAAKTGSGAPLLLDDPLAVLALERRGTAFFTAVQLKEEDGSAYIAAIPYFRDGEDKPRALLLIKDIPFLQLNRDNLITLALYMAYFISEFMDTSAFAAAAAKYPKLDPAIFKEISRLQKLHRDFGTESVLIRFRADYGDMSKEVAAYIESETRGLDLSYSFCGEQCIVLVILPLTDYSNASVFTDRVRGKISTAFASFKGSLEHRTLPIAGDAVLPLLDRITGP